MINFDIVMPNSSFIRGILSLSLSVGNRKEPTSTRTSSCSEIVPLTQTRCALTQQGGWAEGLSSMNFILYGSYTYICFSLTDCQLKQVDKSNVNTYLLMICEFFYTANSFMVFYSINVQQWIGYMLYAFLVLNISQNRKDNRFNSSL